MGKLIPVPSCDVGRSNSSKLGIWRRKVADGFHVEQRPPASVARDTAAGAADPDLQRCPHAAEQNG